MVKIANLGKLQSPPRLDLDFLGIGIVTSADHGNSQELCIEHRTQTQRSRSLTETSSSANCLQGEAEGRQVASTLHEGHRMNSTVIEMPKPSQVLAEDSPGNW